MVGALTFHPLSLPNGLTGVVVVMYSVTTDDIDLPSAPSFTTVTTSLSIKSPPNLASITNPSFIGVVPLSVLMSSLVKVKVVSVSVFHNVLPLYIVNSTFSKAVSGLLPILCSKEYVYELILSVRLITDGPEILLFIAS